MKNNILILSFYNHSVHVPHVNLCTTGSVTLFVLFDPQYDSSNVGPFCFGDERSWLTRWLKTFCGAISTTELCHEALLWLVMIPFTSRFCGGGGCPSDIVPRCHTMVTTVELQRRCIHCRHFEAVNHSSVFRRPYGLLDLLHWMSAGHWGLR